MGRDRYVLLGVGHGRAAWLGSVSQWATAGAIPADFVKCVSVAEARARLNSLQPYSALLVESTTSGFDRDLIATAGRCGATTIVIDGLGRKRDWLQLGAGAVLAPDFSPSDLLGALTSHAPIVSTTDVVEVQNPVEHVSAWRGRLIGVCGPGGTGASTISVALAQGLARTDLDGSLVLLADLARNGDQAMLHDAGELAPGIEEVVEAHRNRRAAGDEIRSYTYSFPSRGYQLLLGIRHSYAWNALAPRAVEAAIDGLQRSFTMVVSDITADFEGESDGGSIDVEERNCLARTVARRADLVLAVGAAGMKGTHSLAAVITALLRLGVTADRILPVVNRGPKPGIERGAISKALAALIANPGAGHVGAPLFLPSKDVDGAFRDNARLPGAIVEPCVSAVSAYLERLEPRAMDGDEPLAVAPGSLGFAGSGRSR